MHNIRRNTTTNKKRKKQNKVKYYHQTSIISQHWCRHARQIHNKSNQWNLSSKRKEQQRCRGLEGDAKMRDMEKWHQTAGSGNCET